MSWYIDSWSPRDGIAFASARQSLTSTSWLRNVQRTVSLRPPSWEPVDVGIATAMRAGRMAFQTGFFTDNHQEIEFSTLDELVEAVRRAYVAAGAGIDDGPLPVDNEPSPPEPDSGSPNEPHEDLSQLSPDGQSPSELDRYRLFSPRGQESRAAEIARLVGRVSLDSAIRKLARESTSLFAARVLGDKRNVRFRPSLSLWIRLLLRGGLLQPHELEGMSDVYSIEEVLDTVASHCPQCGKTLHDSSRRIAATLPPSNVIFHVPLPPDIVRRFGRRWLSDSLLFALSSSAVWTPKQDVDSLAVLLLASCAVVAQQDGPWAYYSSSDARRGALLAASLQWLLMQLPRPLHNTKAEEALNAFASVETVRA